MRHLVRDLASDGATVLVSSHLLSEIEQIATHVGIMAAGALLRQGTLTEVLSDGVAVVRITTPDVVAATEVLTGLGLSDVGIDDRAAAVTGRLGDVSAEDVARAVVSAGVRLRGFSVDRPALEDLFVSITGEGFDVLG